MTRQINQIIDNESGSIMVMALLIMASLAIAGLMVTDDAVREARVGRNYAIYKQSVSAAEAAGKEVIQAIDSIFTDPTVLNGPQAVGILNNVAWQPYDDYNSTFDFDEAEWDVSYRLKPSNLEGTIGYLSSADAIAVLVHQTTSVLQVGLGGSNVAEYYTYVIFCRAEHAGAGNSEAMLMIGYRQEKV